MTRNPLAAQRHNSLVKNTLIFGTLAVLVVMIAYLLSGWKHQDQPVADIRSAYLNAAPCVQARMNDHIAGGHTITNGGMEAFEGDCVRDALQVKSTLDKNRLLQHQRDELAQARDSLRDSHSQKRAD